MSNSLVIAHDTKYHNTIRGIVTKLNKKGNGEITSRSIVYKFTKNAVYSDIKENMLVDMLVAQNKFVTRVDGVKQL